MSEIEPPVAVVVLMGVSGSGKTTIGEKLAEELGWKFHDGDDYHPEANVEKMGSGNPLNDADRAPWLEAIRELIHNVIKDGRSAVVACSALKRSYRNHILEDNDEAAIVYLKGSQEVLRQRLKKREGHFMLAEMLASQLEALQPPEHDERVVTVPINQSPQGVVDAILKALPLEASTER